MGICVPFAFWLKYSTPSHSMLRPAPLAVKLNECKTSCKSRYLRMVTSQSRRKVKLLPECGNPMSTRYYASGVPKLQSTSKCMLSNETAPCSHSHAQEGDVT